MPALLKPLRLIAAVLTLCLSYGAHAATNLPRHGVFVFSNFCGGHQSGDLGGDRITLHRFDNDTLIYEYNDGSTHALVARDLLIDTNAGTFHFAVEVQGEPPSIISGAVTRDGQAVTVQGLPFRGDQRSTLVRVKDVGAPVKECK